jgi:segregation and condensation protein B
MSLKAKLEAVIYAAEEPVTLAQLSALFAADALQWKAEQEAASAEAAAEDAADAFEAGTPMPLLPEGLEYLGLEQTLAVYLAVQPEAEPAEQAAAPAQEPAQEPAEGSSAEDSTENGAEATTDAPVELESATDETSVDAEAEVKRLARQRDREVKAILRQLLDELIASYAPDGRGVEIREIAGGYRMATKPECHDAVRMFVKSLKPPLKLSLPALETLAVIAYKQPVTAPEVNEIRGVESAGVLGSLLARKLIATAGRKPVIGRPILYKTTREFLLRFGLKDLSELPSMEEFEKMAAIELDEAAAEAEREAEAGGAPGPNAGPELDENASEELEAEAVEPEAEAAGQEVESASDAEVETRESAEFAAETPTSEVQPAQVEPVTESPAIEADQLPEEAAPAEPPQAKQAETETSPHD